MVGFPKQKFVIIANPCLILLLIHKNKLRTVLRTRVPEKYAPFSIPILGTLVPGNRYPGYRVFSVPGVLYPVSTWGIQITYQDTLGTWLPGFAKCLLPEKLRAPQNVCCRKNLGPLLPFEMKSIMSQIARANYFHKPMSVTCRQPT